MTNIFHAIYADLRLRGNFEVLLILIDRSPHRESSYTPVATRYTQGNANLKSTKIIVLPQWTKSAQKSYRNSSSFPLGEEDLEYSPTPHKISFADSVKTEDRSSRSDSSKRLSPRSVKREAENRTRSRLSKLLGPVRKAYCVINFI
jgi:hypothetical protein